MEEQTKLQTHKHSDSEIKMLIGNILYRKLGIAINLVVIHKTMGPPEGMSFQTVFIVVVKQFISLQFSRCEG